MNVRRQASPPMLRPIGHIATDYRDLDRVSSQASCAPDEVATITLRPELADGLLGLDRYRHLWVLTWLDRPGSTDEAPLRLVPQAAEAAGQLSGVFASRSPRRPNPIGLSMVRHLETRGNVVTVAGVDLLDGTPVLDIKPWFGDCDDPRVFGPTD